MAVSALLRSSGRTERFTRTGRVRDVAELRRVRAERARAERAEIDQAWARLATDGPVRLADVATLEHSTFERLLDLLGRALAAPAGSDGARRALAADGQTGIALWPPPDARRARVSTPRGVLTAPDYVVRIDAPHLDLSGRAGLADATPRRSEREVAG